LRASAFRPARPLGDDASCGARLRLLFPDRRDDGHTFVVQTKLLCAIGSPCSAAWSSAFGCLARRFPQRLGNIRSPFRGSNQQRSAESGRSAAARKRIEVRRRFA
jgi:hypothetical protein